jgi:hypothetical protein
MRLVGLLLLGSVLAGCGAVRMSEQWSLAPEEAMNPDAMVVEPSRAKPGEIVSLTYPDGLDRGILYAIDARSANEWRRASMLISDAAGGRPMWFEADDESVAVEAIGIAGPGPDRVPIPETLEPGEYRICTANAGENVCTPIDVVEP